MGQLVLSNISNKNQIPIFTANKRNKHLGEQKICLGLSFVSFAKMIFLLTAVPLCCQAGGLLAQEEYLWKQRDVRCSGPSLYWGNCDHELCTDADCRLRCDENDQCNFYA